MKIIRISRNRPSRRALDEAAAVRRIFLVKGRSGRKPLPLIAASLAGVRRRFVLAGSALGLARRHWPGPLTLVLAYKKRGTSLAASAGERTGAVRVPRSAWARAIAAVAGGLVTSTSANLSGEATLYDPRKVAASFRGRRHAPDLMLDAGLLPVRRPSTIVRLKRGIIEVLRQGSVKVKSEKRKEKSSR